MRESPAKLPASLHHSSSSCNQLFYRVFSGYPLKMPLEEISEQKEEVPCQQCFTSSSLARVRKEDAKRASLLESSSLDGNDGSVFKEKEGSLREEDWEASLRCLSLRFRSLEMRHCHAIYLSTSYRIIALMCLTRHSKSFKRKRSS